MVGACLGDTRAASRAETMANNCSKATSFIFHCVHVMIKSTKFTHINNHAYAFFMHSSFPVVRLMNPATLYDNTLGHVWPYYGGERFAVLATSLKAGHRSWKTEV